MDHGSAKGRDSVLCGAFFRTDILSSQYSGCVVIPVVLPNAPQELETRQEIDIPLFLRNRTWVNFQRADPDPMQQLIWGITGKRGSAQ
jgi:hypothetical protein